MNELSTVATNEDGTAIVSAETMLKRLFAVSKILAAVKHQANDESKIAENSSKNLQVDELQYGEDE